MKFGQALEKAKKGERIQRAGWNGKDMWVTGVPGRHDPVTGQFISGHFVMKAADGTMVIGWLASQTDMWAEDWKVLAEH